MKYTVLGAGAMGLRYGILLQEAGFDVDFVEIWEPQISKIREQNGVYVSRDHQNKHLVPVNIYTPEEYTGDPDVWIVFTKQMQLAKALERTSHAFKDHQYALSPMNGMGHIEKLDQYFDKSKVIGATALIGTVLNGPGDVDFIGAPGAGSMHMANQTEKPDDTTNQIVKDFQKANLNPSLTTNFLGTLMAKVIFNSVVNTLCTMFEIQMGEFIQSPVAEKLGRQLINEAFDVCERANITLLNTREEEWQTVKTVSAVSNPLHYPSMYQDMSKGRNTEVDYINGYIYDLGLKYHYEATTHDFLRNLVHLAEFSRDFDPKTLLETVNE
ncbi:ketopantoate reductase family protein [Companilactobacillus mishanensis]|uniref:2-dehydropantoate 2-reductase n=1 Tax=Companilactobacillus mishanensis TaxID=2486008 RepID=A0A5P0ZIG0_9LACO|nr:ketopantoate reductase family protein [Companilactobacillus mishanensis]MQS45567.1 ketopantoate reductase family protein [Companilactobacillus mishanensis]MQS52873.1 ketopantoate reductase family protein [Companilactobacillus mishanensis]MQS89873.1 ketopantoate reductase family protein [Companilactobacillus mishanensis]